MLVSFSSISPSARVWVHQANRPLETHEVAGITQTLEQNLVQWQAHQLPLSAAVKVFENRFVVIAVDEAATSPSGCSIDTLSHWVKDLGQQLNIDFFDRSLLMLDADNQAHSIAISELKAAVQGSILTPDTEVFNTLAKTKDEWETSGKTLAKNTWLRRYFG